MLSNKQRPNNRKLLLSRINYHRRSDFTEKISHRLNETYQELAEHYGTAIIPARVRTPKDKPNAEGTVGNISTWITAALRNEQFFSLNELNHAIHDKLNQFNQNSFKRKRAAG